MNSPCSTTGDKSSKNEYKVCSEIKNLKCSSTLGFSNLGICESVGFNSVFKKSVPIFADHRYPFEFLLNNEYSNVHEDSDYFNEIL